MRETPVLIVGGGPAGLSASLTLSQLGVPSLLVSRYARTLQHPRAVGLMQRTAELLRGWGVEDEVRRRGVPAEYGRQLLWVTTLAGEELGRTATVEVDDVAEEPKSPTRGLRCPQDVTESVLRERAAAFDIAQLDFGWDLVSFEQDDSGVTATIAPHRAGTDGDEAQQVRAEYLLAADGNDSGVRAQCGIGRTGDADMGRFVNIYFRAPLGPLVEDRPAWSYAVLTPDLMGSFVTIDGHDLWLFHVNLAAGETVADFTTERCVRTVRAASGLPDLDVEVISVKSWIMGAELSTAFRDRRVLLTGDAAHRTTPDGGVGMNTAIHSAQNAAWKIGAVVAGWAGEPLLDTYDSERRAVSETNVAYSAGRGRGMMRMVEAIRVGDLDTVREGIAARPSGGRQGMDLGFRYASAAIADDGTTPPEVANPMQDYEPNACPGGRAPHLWLDRNGSRVSTLDLFGRGMVLLTGVDGAAWAPAAAAEDLPLDVVTVVDDGRTDADVRAPEGRFTSLYGIEPSGAVLVRPDGFVGWRAARAGQDPAAELTAALDTVLCRSAG